MTATAQTISQQHAARSLELAEVAHLTGTAHFIAQNAQGETFSVPSRDRHTDHVVFVDRGGVHCNCKAGQFSKPCAHSGAVLHYQQQRAIAQSGGEGDMAWAWWMMGGEW